MAQKNLRSSMKRMRLLKTEQVILHNKKRIQFVEATTSYKRNDTSALFANSDSKKRYDEQ